MAIKKPSSNGEAKKRPSKAAPKWEPGRNETVEKAPAVSRAANVLGVAMQERGLTDKGLAEAIRLQFGYYISDETVRQKRTGKSPLSLVQMDEFSRVLGIPMELFVRPFSETKLWFAREWQRLERGQDITDLGGPDLGLSDSRWSYGSPDHDPETATLVGV